jgi:hypothetical protein
MAELSLEPFAARLRWRLTESQPLEGWQDLMAGLLDELAIACSTSKSHVIGHIKALALLPSGGYLRGSKVSTSYPADVEAQSVGGDTPQPTSAKPPNTDIGSDGFGRSIAAEAATTNASGSASDKNSEYAQLEMTLNLLVYGLPLDSARRIVSETCASAAARWDAELEIS